MNEPISMATLQRGWKIARRKTGLQKKVSGVLDESVDARLQRRYINLFGMLNLI